MDETVLFTLQKYQELWLLEVKQRALQNVGCYRFCEKRGNERVGSTTVVHKWGGRRTIAIGKNAFRRSAEFRNCEVATLLQYVTLYECTFFSWNDADF
jgi:hypothetical protein